MSNKTKKDFNINFEKEQNINKDSQKSLIKIDDNNIQNNLFTSRFIKKNDDNQSKFIFELNKDWWSRPFEYKWSMDLINKNNIVLDAGCGLVHPFRFILAQELNNDNVYACDIESNIDNDMFVSERIRNEHGQESYKDFMKHGFKLFKKIKNSICKLQELTYSDSFFDDIFCISTLEHLEENEIKLALKEFYRVLKNNGRLILTLDIVNNLDVSNMFKFNNLNKFLEIAEEVGFVFDKSNIDTKQSNNDLISKKENNIYGVEIKVFRLILNKIVKEVDFNE